MIFTIYQVSTHCWYKHSTKLRWSSFHFLRGMLIHVIAYFKLQKIKKAADFDRKENLSGLCCMISLYLLLLEYIEFIFEKNLTALKGQKKREGYKG